MDKVTLKEAFKSMEELSDDVYNYFDSNESTENQVKKVQLTEKIKKIQKIKNKKLNESLDESEQLDEKLPKDLANAYKQFAKTATIRGDGSSDAAARAIGWTGDNKDYRPTKNTGDRWDRVNTRTIKDYENAEYKEITPEEALQYKANGELGNLRLLINGKLIQFDNEGHLITPFNWSWSGPGYEKEKKLHYTNRNGNEIENLREIPFKHIINNVDKIYWTNEKDNIVNKMEYNAETGEYEPQDDVAKKRIQNFNDFVKDTGRHPNKEQGRYYSSYPKTIELPNGKKITFKTSKDEDVYTYSKYVRDAQRRLADLEQKWEDGDISKNEYTKQKAEYENDVKRYTQWLNDAKTRRGREFQGDRDRRAEDTYALSKNKLQEPINKYEELKDELKYTQRHLDELEKKGLDRWELKGGSYKEKQNEIAELKAQMQRLADKIAKLEKESQGLEDANNAQNAKAIEDTTKELADLQAEMDKLFRRDKNESLDESEQLVERPILDDREPFNKELIADYKSKLQNAIDLYNQVDIDNNYDGSHSNLTLKDIFTLGDKEPSQQAKNYLNLIEWLKDLMDYNEYLQVQSDIAYPDEDVKLSDLVNDGVVLSEQQFNQLRDNDEVINKYVKLFQDNGYSVDDNNEIVYTALKPLGQEHYLTVDLSQEVDNGLADTLEDALEELKKLAKQFRCEVREKGNASGDEYFVVGTDSDLRKFALEFGYDEDQYEYWKDVRDIYGPSAGEKRNIDDNIYDESLTEDVKVYSNVVIYGDEVDIDTISGIKDCLANHQDAYGDLVALDEQTLEIYGADKQTILDILEENGLDLDGLKVECKECKESLTEKFSEGIPEWFLKYINKKDNFYDGLKDKLLRKGIDLNKVTIVEDELPTGAWDPKYKDPNKFPVFEFSLTGKDYDNQLYIKGINDNDYTYDENYHNIYFKNIPVKTLINKAKHYGYIDKTDSNTSNQDLRAQRYNAKKGVVDRTKTAQYKKYDTEWVDSYYDDKGRYVPGYSKKLDTYKWVDLADKGYDKSGYQSQIGRLKKKLYSASLEDYSERLEKMGNQLNQVQEEVKKLFSEVKLPDMKNSIEKDGNRRTRISNNFSDITSRIYYAQQKINDAVYNYGEVLDSVDYALSKYETDEEKNKAIQRIFGAKGKEGADDFLYSSYDLRNFRGNIEKAKEYIQDAKDLLAGKKESLENKDKENKSLTEATQIDINNPEEVEQGKELIDDNKNTDVEEETMQVVDVDADTVEKLKDSYIGNVLLQCPVCRTPIFKMPEKLVKDEENIADDPDKQLYNVGEQCPHCGNAKGFNLVGQVASMDVEAEKEDENTTGEPDLTDEDNFEQTTEDEISEQPIEDEVEETETEEEDKWDDEEATFESLDIDKFNSIANTYLTEVYGNVESFTTTNATVDDENNKLIIEGVIKYKSGKSKNTQFEFVGESITEDNKYVFKGLNETFVKDNDKAFTLKASIDNNTLISESLDYDYTVTNTKLNESKVVKGSTLK